MAEIVLSPFLQTLFDRLGPIVEDGLRTLSSDLKDIVKPLNDHISFFRAIDLDTTDRRTQERLVREWLDKLKQVAYDINDVLDEVSTEALRQQEVKTLAKVRNFTRPANPRSILFKYEMSDKVKKLIEKVEELAKCRDLYQLHGSGHSSVPPVIAGRVLSQTSSSKNEVFLGRDKDVSVILDLLLSQEFRLSNVDFIPILGISGVGKTALAKEVYNHKKVDEQFYQKMWVSVTESDDARQVIKSIIESSTREACPLLDLDSMQKQLQDQLLNYLGKYLLVIDGMWNESDDYLEKLKIPLSLGPSGSKVLITTSSRHVAKLMKTVCIHELKVLSYADCLIIFNEYAFKDRKKCEYAYLNEICGMIVKKCKGLPLAAKAYGRLLRFETSAKQWEHIANKEIEEVCAMSNNIFKRLAANIKSCFTFCSIFPPNYQFDKMQLIQLWMALDFIADEEEGSQIFDQMFRLSLFQPGQCFVSKKEQQTFLMHDSYRSIAQTNCGEECYMMENQEATSNISAKTRHASIMNQDQEINFNSLYAAKGLYTLLLSGNPLSKIPNKLAKSLERLRSLDLSFTNIQELPDSVGKLMKHLRYVSLRDTKIRMLPESVTKLYNLQTLILRNCYELIELPNCTYKLCKLRHLDLHLDDLDDHSKGSNLTSMPPAMRKLTQLRTLSRYVVSQNNGCRISELGGLPTLQGGVCLLNLECVANANEAEEAKIEEKKHIDMLELRWGNYLEEARVEYRSVLEQLRPHNNLKELRIEGYKGDTFPPWISDVQRLKSLVTLKLTHCTACRELPQLGKLPSLKQLFLKGMHSVTAINCNLCCEGGDGSTPFQALRKLQLESMQNLTEWSGGRECNLPYLRELIIIDCPKLQHLSHDCLILEKLEIDRCPKLETMGRFPSLSNVKITGQLITSTSVQIKTYKKIQQLELSSCSDLVDLPDDWLPTSLTSLKIKDCPLLQALPGGLKDLHCLVDFEVKDCMELGRLPEQMSCMASLERFELFNCPKISSLPSDGLPTRLQFLSVEGCPLLRDWFYEDQGEWSSITRITSVWVDRELLWSSSINSLEASTSRLTI